MFLARPSGETYSLNSPAVSSGSGSINWTAGLQDGDKVKQIQLLVRDSGDTNFCFVGTPYVLEGTGASTLYTASQP
jgi:hypothetical protein